MQLLKVGDALPEFETKDQYGDAISRNDLLGSPFVLYFYPKDDTPGCTKEACEFRDVMDGFDEIEVLVVGVSPDSTDSHRKFIEKHELNFPLISDTKKELSEKCGVVDSNGNLIRTTFIFDEDGIVQWVESPVTVDGHVQRVMTAIQEVLA